MSELERRWASAQIEAAADDTLAPADAARMRAALAADADLRAALARALALRTTLQSLNREPVPLRLRSRLLRIASAAPMDARWRAPLVASAAALATVIAVGIGLWFRAPPPAATTADVRAQALTDFATAMTYLNKSAAIAGNETTAAVGAGLRNALALSRAAAAPEESPPTGNGD